MIHCVARQKDPIRHHYYLAMDDDCIFCELGYDCDCWHTPTHKTYDAKWPKWLLNIGANISQEDLDPDWPFAMLEIDREEEEEEEEEPVEINLAWIDSIADRFGDLAPFIRQEARKMYNEKYCS